MERNGFASVRINLRGAAGSFSQHWPDAESYSLSVACSRCSASCSMRISEKQSGAVHALFVGVRIAL